MVYLVCRPGVFYGTAPVHEEASADGLPIAGDEPMGASVVVWRRRDDDLEVLLLHRAHEGPDYEGDWAWTVPAGARFPGEPVEECAQRELHEEAGIEAQPVPTGCGPDGWPVFVLEVDDNVEVRVDDMEHDRHAWVSAEEAIDRCLPSVVSDGIACALQVIRSGAR
jgi:8-oxo-dGTP pyrophosphatase MutT (NUDIX family)